MTKTNTDINLDKFNQVQPSTALLKDFLQTDGALRDIYVDKCSINDWEKVLDALRSSDFSLRFFVDENESKLPADISGFFVDRQHSLKLEVTKRNIIINSFFFSQDQIEFDLDPRDFVVEEQHKIIFEFMSLLSNATFKPVKLCDENSGDTPFFVLLSDKRVYVAKKRYWS